MPIFTAAMSNIHYIFKFYVAMHTGSHLRRIICEYVLWTSAYDKVLKLNTLIIASVKDELYHLLLDPPSLNYCNLRSCISLIINCQHCSIILQLAVIKALIKKTSLDLDQLENNGPIADLPFLSKVLEQVVADQLHQHLFCNRLHEKLHSCFRTPHSIQTAPSEMYCKWFEISILLAFLQNRIFFIF